MSKKVSIGSRLFSLGIALSIFGAALLPEGDFYDNIGLVVHVVVWAILVLGIIAIFVVDETPKGSLWWSIPLTILWASALAYVNWSAALVTYVIFSILSYAKNHVTKKDESNDDDKPEELKNLT